MGYIIIMVAAIVALYWYQLYCLSVRRKFGPWSKEYHRVFRSHVISLPLLAGLFAAQTIWGAKATIGLITVSAALGENQVATFGFWALAIMTVVLVLSQLRFLTAALTVVSATATASVGVVGGK